MPQPNPSLFGALRAQIERLGSDLRGAGLLRWELARLELGAALGQLRRLAIRLAVAVALAAISLPVAVVLAAEVLAALTGQNRIIWLAVLVGGLLLLAGSTGWLAWRHFRARFVGLEQTLEELQEDLNWLSAWASRRANAAAEPPQRES